MYGAARRGSSLKRPSPRPSDEFADDPPPPDFDDGAAVVEVSEAAPVERAPTGPLHACVRCGEAPGTPGDCDHPELIHVADPSPALREAVAKLKAMTQERRAHDRALRRLVDEADIEDVTKPTPTVAVTVTVAADERCPRCGRDGEGATPVRRRRRATNDGDAQGVLGLLDGSTPPLAQRRGAAGEGPGP